MMRIVAPTGAILACFAVPALAQVGESWDFEDGTLRGWTATGTAFAHQPTFGNNIVSRRPGESVGQQGNYWIGTYENHPRPFPPAGQVQGDEPQGTLVSQPFTLSDRWGFIDFMVGGGNGDWNGLTEYVGLIIKCPPQRPCRSDHPDLIFHEPDGDYELQYADTGNNNEHMQGGAWDVSDFYGETARVVIIDRSSAPWGHINVDWIRTSWWSPLRGNVPGGTRSILPKIRVPGPGPVVKPHGPNVARLINSGRK